MKFIPSVNRFSKIFLIRLSFKPLTRPLPVLYSVSLVLPSYLSILYNSSPQTWDHHRHPYFSCPRLLTTPRSDSVYVIQHIPGRHVGLPQFRRCQEYDGKTSSLREKKFCENKTFLNIIVIKIILISEMTGNGLLTGHIFSTFKP